MKLSGVTCYVILSLQSTQQLLRALDAHLLSLFMGYRLGYLLMQLLVIRVGGLLQLTSYSTFSSLSMKPRIISREPRSTRSATLTSTTAFRSIRWENKCCSLQRPFTCLGLKSFELVFLDLSGCWSELGRLPTDWILRGDSKMFRLSSTSPSIESTPLEAHLQTHPSQSKLKVKNPSR